MGSGTALSRLMDDYGNLENKKQAISKMDLDNGPVDDNLEKDNTAAELMQLEERVTGAVEWNTYRRYLWFAGGIYWAPVIILLLILSQAAQGEPAE